MILSKRLFFKNLLYFGLFKKLLKTVIRQDSWSNVKDSCDFLKKIKNIGKIPEGAILVTAEVIGLYLSISHGAGLEAL